MPLQKRRQSLGGLHGCTVAQAIITVDPSNVSRWYQPMGAIREPGPTTQSTAAAPPIQHPSTHTTSRPSFRPVSKSAFRSCTMIGSVLSPPKLSPFVLQLHITNRNRHTCEPARSPLLVIDSPFQTVRDPRRVASRE